MDLVLGNNLQNTYSSIQWSVYFSCICTLWQLASCADGSVFPESKRVFNCSTISLISEVKRVLSLNNPMKI